MLIKNWRLVANFFLFQLGWFGCLLLNGFWPLLLVVSILCFHFGLLLPKSQWRSEIQLLLKVLCVGACIEIVYLRVGILVRLDGSLLPPLWLLLIWLLFAMTFNHSLLWLRNRLYIAAIFAAIAAPCSYYAGASMNSLMSLNSSTIFSLLSISLSWALVFPLLLRWFIHDETT
jgi:hypothetical protein